MTPNNRADVFELASPARSRRSCQTLAAMQISAATVDDARGIAEVHVLTWQHAYRHLLPAEFLASLPVEKREAMWRECIAKGSPEILVAKSEGELCGFVAFGASRDEGALPLTAEVIAIYVAPRFWSTGAGRQLWQASLRRMVAQGFNAVTLWVIANNDRAIRFYTAAGFSADPASLKQFTLGGTALEEVRYTRSIGG